MAESSRPFIESQLVQINCQGLGLVLKVGLQPFTYVLKSSQLLVSILTTILQASPNILITILSILSQEMSAGVAFRRFMEVNTVAQVAHQSINQGSTWLYLMDSNKLFSFLSEASTGSLTASCSLRPSLSDKHSVTTSVGMT